MVRFNERQARRNMKAVKEWFGIISYFIKIINPPVKGRR